MFEILLSGNFCDICRTYNHPSRHCVILQNYSLVPNTMYCKFCGMSTHNKDKCRDLYVPTDILDRISFWVTNNCKPKEDGIK